MSNFFYESLKTGLLISVLILITLFSTKIINHFFRATWRFRVWKVFTICLIIPISFIISKIKIFSFDHTISVATSKNIVTTPITFETIASHNKPLFLEQQFYSVSDWIFVIWVMGVCVYSLYLIYVYISFRKIVKECKVIDELTADQERLINKNKRKRLIPIYKSQIVAGPMITGILKPAIIIPDKEYEKEKLKIVIEHELTHYLRRDLWYKGISLLALIIHWYNPIVHIMSRVSSFDMELCCDQDVIKNKDKEFCILYSDVIMDSILDTHKFRGAVLVCMCSKKKNAEDRFLNIFKKKKNGGLIFIIAILLVFFSGGFAFADINNNFNFSAQPGYDKLLGQRIAEQEEFIMARNEYWSEHPEKFIITEDNQIKYPKGESQKIENTEKEKQFSAKDSIIEPHVLDNGQTGLYLNKNEKPWNFVAGDVIHIKIGADIEHFNSSGYLLWGYYIDNERKLIDKFYIKQEKDLEFKVPSDGEYKFFLICGSSDPIIIKYLYIY